MTSELKIGYLDDVTIGGSLGSVIDDVERFRHEDLLIGLELNPSKCEVIGLSDVAGDLTFDGFARVGFDDAELVGSPLARGRRQNAISEAKCIELERAMSRLNLIDSHYAFSIISNCISAPKLLYTWSALPVVLVMICWQDSIRR